MGNEQSHPKPQAVMGRLPAQGAAGEGTPVSPNDNIEKGMHNSLGLNHCFLNVVIQSLWHLKSFRERFFSLVCGLSYFFDLRFLILPVRSEYYATGCCYQEYNHRCPVDQNGKKLDCVFCSLSTIFNNYKYAQTAFVLPDPLRSALHKLYSTEQRFAWGTMCDAGEAMEEILHWFHSEALETSRDEAFDKACNPKCISHTVFGAFFCDVVTCARCRANK